MRGSKNKQKYIEYFTARDVLWEARNRLPLLNPNLGIVTDDRGIIPEILVESVTEKASKLNFDEEKFGKLLKSHISSLIGGKKPTSRLFNFLQGYIGEIENEIRMINGNEVKAKDALRALIECEGYQESDQVYDAIVLLGNEVSKSLIRNIVKEWKEEEQAYRKRHENSPFPEGDIFWVSLDFKETIDGISRYRLMEQFNIGEFEQAFYAVQNMFANSFLEGTSGIESIMMAFQGDVKITAIAYDLWLASRSKTMPIRINEFVNITLRRICAWQSDEGWWTDSVIRKELDEEAKSAKQRSTFLPNTYTTALCTLDILKLAKDEDMRNKGKLGAQWLLSQQNANGSWSRISFSEDRIETREDLFTTLLSLESLIRSEIPNLGIAIESGIDWVRKQQTELGFWDDEGFPFPFMTVITLELLGSKKYIAKSPNDYFSMAREFMKRSMEFSLEKNVNSYRLSTITAFQGIEALLYSFLTDPSINISIFKKSKPDETIGMRKALDEFEGFLYRAGKLARGKNIDYKTSLDSLSYYRNQVVHKGIAIHEQTCKSHVEDVMAFASKYSEIVFGASIF